MRYIPWELWKKRVYFTYRFFRRSGLKFGQGIVVRRRLMGVTTGGVTWSVGKHCLYTNRDDRTTRLGTIVNMFYGENDMEDDFVIFQLQSKPITAKMGHYSTALIGSFHQTWIWLIRARLPGSASCWEPKGGHLVWPCRTPHVLPRRWWNSSRKYVKRKQPW